MVPTSVPQARALDIDRPCAARIHNAFLGGSHNFGIDRTFAEQLENDLPGITETYRESRAFLHRSVEHLITLGVRQFVDFGSGTPTIGHIHEIAVRYTRNFRVLYSDNEPLTVAFSRGLLDEQPTAEIVEADCRNPDAILDSPQAAELIDFTQPVAFIFSSVLHFIADHDDPAGLMAYYRDYLPAGSYLVISHLTDHYDPEPARILADRYATTSDPLHMRATAHIDRFFGDFEILAPGTGQLPDWRPEAGQRTCQQKYRLLHGGVARKP